MSTSSGDSSSNNASASLVNFNSRRQSNSSSSGSHPTLKSFSSIPPATQIVNNANQNGKHFGKIIKQSYLYTFNVYQDRFQVQIARISLNFKDHFDFLNFQVFVIHIN